MIGKSTYSTLLSMTAIWIVLSLFGYKAFAIDLPDLVGGYVSDATEGSLNFEFSDDEDDPLGLHVLEDPPGNDDETPTDESLLSYPPISPSAFSFFFGSPDMSRSCSRADLSRSRILSASSTLCSPLEEEEGDDDETELEKIGSLYDLFQIINDASDTFQNRVDAATLAFVKGHDTQQVEAAEALFALAKNKVFDAEDRSDALKILLRKGTDTQQVRAKAISMDLAAEMFGV